MAERAPQRILVIDDDDVFCNRLVRAFGERGLEARGASDHASALAAARELAPDVAVVDLRMPDSSGIDVLRDLLDLDPDMRVVVLTGYGSIATALESVRRGAVDYLTKPAHADEILAAIDRQEEGAPAEGEAAVPDVAPSLERVEWEHIQRVLTDCGGNVSQAARVLGIHRRTLQRKLSNVPPQR